MDDLETWMLQSHIHSKGCTSAVLFDPENDLNRLLSLLLAIADDFLIGTFGKGMRRGSTKSPDVFMVDGGAPEFFVFTDLQTPVIWYSKAYIAKHLQFRDVIMAEKGFETSGIGNLLEILGSFYMSLKNETFARTCFLQSLIELRADPNDRSLYEQTVWLAHVFSLSQEPAEGAEAAFIALYFGLAHELGHVYGPNSMADAALQSHPLDLNRKAISKALLEAGMAVHKANLCEYAYKAWSAKAQQGFEDPRSIFNVDSLRSEIVADWIGFQILLRFIEFVAGRRGRTYNKKIFVSELVVGLFVLQLIEQCRHIAKRSITRTRVVDNDGKDSTPLSIYFPFEFMYNDSIDRPMLASMETLIDFSAVHWARIGFLKPTLTTFVLVHLFPDTYSVERGSVSSRVNRTELARRESVALQNLEGYFGFYHNAFMKLLLKFGDVDLFSAHLVTDTPPPPELNPAGAKGLSEAIAKNFGLHIERLKTEGDFGRSRRSELLNQISRYRELWQHRGIPDEVLVDAHKKLSEG
jgi:hypothetical protein